MTRTQVEQDRYNLKAMVIGILIHEALIAYDDLVRDQKAKGHSILDAETEDIVHDVCKAVQEKFA